MGPSGRSQSLSGLGTLLSAGSLAAAPFTAGTSVALGAGALGAGTAGGLLGAHDSADQAAATSDQNYLDSQMDMNEQAAQEASQPRQQAMQLLSQYIPQTPSGALSMSNMDNGNESGMYG